FRSLEVVRAGKVVVANPLGSGVLENPVFLRYLPDIAKQLLGRQMSIKTVTTYWCGDADDLNYVRAHFEQLVIKPIFRGQSQHSQFVGALSQAQQRELLAKIEARPMYYVAQPIVALSKQPSYQDGSLQARPSILRSFISASEGSYIVMPGGLTRVGQQESARHISNQLGSYSKDTWVLASEPHVVEQTAAAATGLHQQADLISLPSRVVENLFWMGRYAERVEASLRLLRTIFIMFNGEELPSDNVRRLLLTALTRLTSTYPGFVDADAQLIAAPNDELLALVVDVNRLGSISANLNAMFYCADQSKEQMSSDALRVINDIRDMLVELQDTLSFDLLTAPEEALDPLVTALMAFSGLAHESMVRGVGWRFMEIGRRLERAMLSNKLIAELLTQRQSEADERLLASAALLCMENLISYRRRYSADINVESCLDLLMLARENPRALIFQLDHLYQYLAALPKAEQSSNELSVEESLAFKAQSQVKLSGLASLSQVQGDKRPELVRQMQELTELLEGISNAIGAKYFDHREVSHQLGQGSWGAQS
ncbi:MAG: circularly permuted type 2 ATP-grasp protein, partial [Cellvibrionaceae bacterium]|nr:circularly permuted type 2 ATP-grasp protein [Cellvibrionaceae bacterium]